MGFIVQKYGGTSVSNLEKIKWVAEHVVKTKEQGNQVLVVVSAMAGETDRLVKLCHQRQNVCVVATDRVKAVVFVLVASIASEYHN